MKRIVASIALFMTWIVIFLCLTLLTQFIMVPWDTAITLPEIGTWQRTLNDFFATAPGYFLFSGTLLLISIILSINIVKNNGKRLMLLIVGNIAFVIFVLGVFTVATLINSSVLFPYPDVVYDPTYKGFHHSVFPGLCILAVCGIWLYWQLRPIHRSKL